METNNFERKQGVMKVYLCGGTGGYPSSFFMPTEQIGIWRRTSQPA